MLSLTEQFKGKLKEVFLYITYRCNLKCPYCYLGDNKKKIDISSDAVEPLLKKLLALGASKITFLGGEPTLHPFLPQFINIAKVLGFNYLRLDTNGQFNPAFLENMLEGLTCPLLMKENYKRYKRKGILPVCISFKQTNKDNQPNYLKNNLAGICG